MISHSHENLRNLSLEYRSEVYTKNIACFQRVFVFYLELLYLDISRIEFELQEECCLRFFLFQNIEQKLH